MASTACAAPPDLREQVSLDGTWDFTPKGGEKTTIPVPEYWDAGPGFKTDEAVYAREVEVPASFAGKRVTVEFDSVCQIAEVAVNGQPVGTHVGGWIPFSFDITDLVTPGKTFTLRVNVFGGNHMPIVSDKGAVQWPVGWYGHQMRWGINFDVWLRAYGVVSIEDAQIVTSFRKQTLTVTYELYNSDIKPRTVTIKGEVRNPATGGIEKALASRPVTLAAGERRTVTVSKQWENPLLWFPYPDTRHPLYHLQSRVEEGKTIVDRETRRFGFREVWIEGDHYMLNGIRLNLYGANITDHHEGYKNARYQRMTRETWPQTLAQWEALNVRFARFHMAPVDPFVLDACDEQGFLVMEESAIYAREYVQPAATDTKAFLENSKQWIGPWVRSRRNHPCIVQWSAENEMLGYGDWRDIQQDARQWGAEIRKYDVTRPVVYEGDGEYFRDFSEEVYDLHYPEGYLRQWQLPIYGYRLEQDGVPNGIGEFLTSYDTNGPANQWMQGTIVRGLRYTNWADIRPYTTSWVWRDLQSEKTANLRNGQAFVALFDKGYDSLGTAPLAEGKLPELRAGSRERRDCVLYNDEFRDTEITVSITLKSGDTVCAAGQRIVTLPLGEHADIPCEFQVPNLGGATLDMVLETRKRGEMKFSETKRFTVVGEKAPDASTSPEINIGAPRLVNLRVQSDLRIATPFAPSRNGKRGVVRLTLTNQEEKETAQGQVTLSVEPQGGGRVVGDAVLTYTLRPGKRVVREFAVEVFPGRSTIRTRSEALGLRNSAVNVSVASPIARLASVPSVEQFSAALRAVVPKEIQYGGQPLARVQYAVAGEFLAVQAQVLDARITPELKAWPDTALDVMASAPDTWIVRQVVFLPKGPDGAGQVDLNENGRALPAPQIAWKVAPLPGHGYALSALIPLSLYKLDFRAKEFLLECATAAAPAADVPVQYVTLFRSVAAFRDNSHFGWVVVADEEKPQ